jgi:hypothetical protein
LEEAPQFMDPEKQREAELVRDIDHPAVTHGTIAFHRQMAEFRAKMKGGA